MIEILIAISVFCGPIKKPYEYSARECHKRMLKCVGENLNSAGTTLRECQLKELK